MGLIFWFHYVHKVSFPSVLLPLIDMHLGRPHELYYMNYTQSARRRTFSFVNYLALWIPLRLLMWCSLGCMGVGGMLLHRKLIRRSPDYIYVKLSGIEVRHSLQGIMGRTRRDQGTFGIKS